MSGRTPESDTSETPTFVPAGGAAPVSPPPGPAGVGRRGTARYRIDEEIGRGGTGVVFRAFDQDLSREFALKVMLREGDIEDDVRFVEEARGTARLQRPAIVPIHDIGVGEDGRVFFAMKLVRGQ